MSCIRMVRNAIVDWLHIVMLRINYGIKVMISLLLNVVNIPVYFCVEQMVCVTMHDPTHSEQKNCSDRIG